MFSRKAIAAWIVGGLMLAGGLLTEAWGSFDYYGAVYDTSDIVLWSVWTAVAWAGLVYAVVALVDWIIHREFVRSLVKPSDPDAGLELRVKELERRVSDPFGGAGQEHHS